MKPYTAYDRDLRAGVFRALNHIAEMRYWVIWYSRPGVPANVREYHKSRLKAAYTVLRIATKRQARVPGGIA